MEEEGLNTSIVYQMRIKKEAKSKLDSVDPDVIYDPTLPRTNDPKKKVCPQCSYYQAVFFQADSGHKDSDMALVSVCTRCKHKWIMQHGEKDAKN